MGSLSVSSEPRSLPPPADDSGGGGADGTPTPDIKLVKGKLPPLPDTVVSSSASANAQHAHKHDDRAIAKPARRSRRKLRAASIAASGLIYFVVAPLVLGVELNPAVGVVVSSCVGVFLLKDV